MAMRYDPETHRRRSIRLPGYDYSRPGAYFVTLCTQDRLCLLGNIEVDQMAASDVGRMVETWWTKLPKKFPTCETDAFTLMPNHVHGVIVIRERVGADPRVRPGLPRMVQWFKTMTTNMYLHAIQERGWEPLPGRLWQRNYYEHIVRNERQLQRLRRYIRDNPRNWASDPDRPS